MPASARRPRFLRVLMLSDVYFPRINGVSTSIETFRADLAAEGIEAQLIAPEYPERHDAPATWRIPSRRLPFDPEDRLMRWGPLTLTADRVAAGGVDLVHIQTPFAAHYAGLRAARHHGLPVLATYHTHFEEYIAHYLPLLPRSLLKAAARRIATGQCNALDAVVVPSRAMHDTLTGYGVTAPLHVLPTGIPVGRFTGGNGAAFRARHDIPAAASVALFVGRVAFEKNISFLIDALAAARRQQPGIVLVIAGEGPALPGLRRHAQRAGMTSHVRFVGYLDRATDLPDCYAAADVFAFASRTETQGIVLLEAMASGLPVLALAEMGTRDILEPQRGAVLGSDDAAAFGAQLAALIADPARLAALSAAASEYALDWAAPARARQLAALYRTLVEARAGSPVELLLPSAA